MSEPATVKVHPLRKTKAQLFKEVESLRLRVAELEDAAAPHEWRGRALRESEESKDSDLGAIAADVTERKRAEEVLRESEQQLQLLTDALPALISYVDSGERYRLNNTAYEHWFGHTREQLYGRHVKDVLGEAAYDAIKPHINTALSGETVTFETLLPYKHGGHRFVRANYVPHVLESGQVSGFFVLVEDITEPKRLEEALMKSEARLRSVMDHAPAEIFLIDTDCRYVLVNREFERRYNITEEEVKGKTIHDFFPADIAGEFSAQDREVLETAKATVKEQQIEYGGALHTDLEVKFPIVDSTGAVTGIGGIATDITKLKRAEEALRESEVRYRTLATVAPVGIFHTDAQGLVTYVNEKWCGIGGMASEEAKGTGWVAALHPEDRENIAAKWDAFARNQTAFRTEYRYQRPDGATAYCYVQALPVTDTDGNLTGYVGYVVDITERKRAEEALQEARDELEGQVDARTKELHDSNQRLESEIVQRTLAAARFEALLEAGPDPTISVDHGGRIVEVNSQVEGALGYRRDELIGQKMEILVPDLLRDRHIGHRQAYIRNPSSRQMGTGLELAITCKDGRELPVEISLSPARVAGEGIVIASIRDITERKRVEEELQGLSARLIHAQEEERKRIARELHDDFNQRLALITMDIEQLVLVQAKSSENLDGHFRNLLDRVKELSLDMHRLSHRLHPAALDHLSLAKTVKSLCHEMSALHDLRIRFTGTEIPDVVPKDVALCCYRIVQEALRNFIKHSGAREAHVELARTKQGLKLHVRDQGAGFDVAGVESRGGLGLISMRERLRLVGGQIAIKSSAAHGTEIAVFMPLSAADAV